MKFIFHLPRAIASQTIVFGFALLITLGTALLMLPFARVKGVQITFIDALFTSTSAICVTGLVVTDTGKQLSLWGQLIVLLLIQLGGLGYMVVSTAIALFIGKKVTLSDKVILQESIPSRTYTELLPLVKFTILITVIVELVGSVLLSFRFVPQYGWLTGIYYAIFHAVSAFCNAGFALFPNNFVIYATDTLVVLTLAGLIIIGGIGYTVLNDLRKSNVNWRKFTLHTKVSILVTIFLLISGTVFIYFTESINGGSITDFSTKDKFITSFFSAVTPRTAGFNVINMVSLHTVTIWFTICLMFIGASPGGTGGGVKTTSAMVVFRTVLSTFQGKKEVNLLHRRLSLTTVNNALVLFCVALTWIFFVTLLILLIEPKQNLTSVLFEVTSAFGTVGLSLGNETNNLSLAAILSPYSKLLLSLTMFIGRIGLLTVGIALGKDVVQRYRYPEDQVIVG